MDYQDVLLKAVQRFEEDRLQREDPSFEDCLCFELETHVAAQHVAEAADAGRLKRLAAYIVMLEDAWMDASGVTSQDRRGARALNRARQGVDFDLGRPTDSDAAPAA